MTKKNQKIAESFFIIVFSIIIALNAYYFLIVLEKSFLEWITTNLCSVASFLVIIGFLFKNKIILNATIPMILVFSIGGLFMMGWNNFMRIYSQVHHILMILSSVYILSNSFKEKAFRAMKIGLLIGVIAVFFLGDIASQPSFNVE